MWSVSKAKCVAEQQMPDHVDEGSQVLALEQGSNGQLMSATEDSHLTIFDSKVSPLACRRQ